MINLSDYIPQKRLNEFCQKHHIKKISLFGSALHSQMTAESDIDLLVEFKENQIPGLMDLAGMEIELTELIGKKVDLRTPEELSRYFRDEVLKKAKVEYAA